MCGSKNHDEGGWELYPPLPEGLQEVAGEIKERLSEGTLPEDIYTQILESQCGATDDSQAVEQYNGTLGVTTAFVNAHQAPVGQLQWNANLASIYTDAGDVAGVRWCTGTLLAGNLFLSAGHCFDSVPRTPGSWQLPLTNGTTNVIPPPEIATNMHVNFNFQVDASGNPRPEQQFAILQLTEHRLGGFDFAIIRLAGNPEATFGSSIVAAADPATNDMACIIGHPAGVRKRIEAGPVTELNGSQIRYNDIDTLGGNSGSGILRSPDGTIVGVHTNGGCTTAGAGFNFGVRVSTLLANSPTLRGLSCPKVSGPVVSWGSGRLDAFVTGTDSALYHKWWNGSAWGPSLTGYEGQGGVCTSRAEVAAWGPNRLDAFVTGTDGALYHKWWNGSAWGPSLTGYERQGGVCTSPPKVVAWGPNRLDVFVTGTDSALYHKWWNGSAWGPSLTGYENQGGICTSAPEAVAWGSNRLDVFVIGTDSALYHKWWNGSAWGPSLTGYERQGGVCVGPPKAVAWGPNRLDVFVIGTDRALYHKWWNGSAWGPSLTGYERQGGICTSPPEVVSWGPNRLDVFVIGTDRALYHKWWNGSSWGPSLTGWERMGGVCTSQPRVVSWGPNRLDVFVTGTDRALYHKWWDGSAWGPSLTGYERQGGIVIDF